MKKNTHGGKRPEKAILYLRQDCGAYRRYMQPYACGGAIKAIKGDLPPCIRLTLRGSPAKGFVYFGEVDLPLIRPGAKMSRKMKCATTVGTHAQMRALLRASGFTRLYVKVDRVSRKTYENNVFKHVWRHHK